MHLFGKWLFVAGMDPIIRAFNLETGATQSYVGHSSWILCLRTYV